MSTLLVTGRIKDKTITRPIEKWSPAAEEAIPTMKKDIRNAFKEIGFQKEDVTFIIKNVSHETIQSSN